VVVTDPLAGARAALAAAHRCKSHRPPLLGLHILRPTPAPSGDRGGYIPYRDSKLTRLLQPSLGGNAKITIICTVTGALLSSDETHNTLKFANRAKRMKNHAAINEVSNEKVGGIVWCGVEERRRGGGG